MDREFDSGEQEGRVKFLITGETPRFSYTPNIHQGGTGNVTVKRLGNVSVVTYQSPAEDDDDDDDSHKKLTMGLVGT